MRRFPKETSFSYFHPYGEKPQRDAAQEEWRRRYESLYLSGKKRGDVVMTTETIAAIASGLTHAGIGIIRISGPDALQVGDRVVTLKNGKAIAAVLTHTVHYGLAHEGEEVLDEILAVVMRAPHSFTGEDVVELQCHGGPLIMRRLLDAVLHQGARLAEPGEFTRRAFLNGRMDLSQAEAVMDLIHSQNEFARKASIEQLQGQVSEKVKKLREKILYQLAFIEAALDDPEHISTEGYQEELNGLLDPLIRELDVLLKDAGSSRILADGVRTVILGRPNAGKSSLLNLLVGEERAIVTDIAGTTRDTLEENIPLGGISLRLVDTAGIRETEDQIEQMGVERAKAQAEKADLLIHMVDASRPLAQEEDEIFRILKGKRAVILMNKSDLTVAVDAETVREKAPGVPVLTFSAREGIGKDALEKTILDMFEAGEIGKRSSVTITNLRHKDALEHARDSLCMVKQSIADGMPEDFYSIDLMEAYRQLGLIIGESVEDDLVNEIFAKFCMGK